MPFIPTPNCNHKNYFDYNLVRGWQKSLKLTKNSTDPRKKLQTHAQYSSPA